MKNIAFSLGRWIWFAILFAVVTVLAWATPRAWGYFLYTHQVRSLQRQCLGYFAPQNQIIYDTDPSDRKKLLASNDGYRAFNNWAVFYVPAAWHDFRGSYDCPDGTAFVHARTSPAGHERLVAIDIIPVRQDAIELRPSVMNIAPRFDVKKLEICRRSMGRAGDEWSAKDKGSIRVYAGRPDPRDASRFDISADFGEGRIVIHCQLKDDDSIAIGHD